MDIKSVSTNFVVRTETITNYLREINKIYPYTAQEEKEKFIEYNSTDDEMKKIEIRNDIILHNQRFIFAIAKRYDSTGNLTCDLVSIGNLGLMEAFKEFDYTRGFRFYSYAAYFVQRAINGYFVKEHLMVRPTNNVRVAAKVKKIKNDFYVTNGREPSSIEIIEILGEKYKIFITDPNDVCGVRIEYIDANVTDDSDSSTFEECEEWNEVTASKNDYEKVIDDDNLSYAMSEALKTLDEREKIIVMMANGIGYDHEYKDKEIADKLGYTSERIRQLRHHATEKMKSTYLAKA